MNSAAAAAGVDARLQLQIRLLTDGPHLNSRRSIGARAWWARRGGTAPQALASAIRRHDRRSSRLPSECATTFSSGRSASADKSPKTCAANFDGRTPRTIWPSDSRRLNRRKTPSLYQVPIRCGTSGFCPKAIRYSLPIGFERLPAPITSKGLLPVQIQVDGTHRRC